MLKPSEMNASARGVNLTIAFEGKEKLIQESPTLYTAYQCSAKKWTIGIGCTKIMRNGKLVPVEEGMVIGEDEVWSNFRAAHRGHQVGVAKAIRGNLTQYQFDALADFCFQFGVNKLADWNGEGDPSGIANALNAGNLARVPVELAKWRLADGRPNVGVYRRSLARACVFNGLPWEKACAYGTVDLNTTLQDVFARAKAHQAELDAAAAERRAQAERAAPAPVATPAEAPKPKKTPKPVKIEESALPEPKKESTVKKDLPMKNEAPGSMPADQWPGQIDPGAPLKRLEDSERFWGALIMVIGAAARNIAAMSGAVVLPWVAFLGEIGRDPAIITALAFLGASISGEAVKRIGMWKRARGQKTATQAIGG